MHSIICYTQICPWKVREMCCLTRVWWEECWLLLLLPALIRVLFITQGYKISSASGLGRLALSAESSVKCICPFQRDPQSSAGLLGKGVGALKDGGHWLGQRGHCSLSWGGEHCHLGSEWHLSIISAVMTELGALCGAGSTKWIPTLWIPTFWLCWGLQLFWHCQIQVLLLSEKIPI